MSDRHRRLGAPPGGWCGLVGLKPSLGAFRSIRLTSDASPAYDRTVDDNALMMSCCRSPIIAMA